ncbi:hypothetical protein IV454_24045 [Massilia antarctica]|uniref:Phage tail protein n=1 Tax=Massilia antarctica TaxID=2765360 RepID=A0AA49A6N6_9BURK|nr:phage tail protein [Massilia antarctica]QPI48573.1 hypothetical protein IV454_24045 [Massilia antarctica]
MSLSASRPAPPPAPPHDPYSLLLSGRIGARPDIGWRVRRLERVEIDLPTRALVLGPAPAAARWLSEPNGSFGGLRSPSNVARTAGGEVLLLDPASGALLRFDPCACRFQRLPCFTSVVDAGAAPCLERSGLAGAAQPPLNRLRDPQAIALCRGDLYIADRGHGRVLRYALDGLVPRAALRLPAAALAALAVSGWRPTGLAIDGHGTLWVSDPDNGRIDSFNPRGKWLGWVAAGRGVTHLAFDCRDRLHAVIEADVQVQATVGAQPLALQLDGQSAGFHWQSLQLPALPAGARFTMAIDIGDAAWSPAELDDPANPRWSAWLAAADLARLADPLPLAGVGGRYLRLRLAPEPGHVPTAPFDVLARGARVLRIEGQAIDLLPRARADLVEGFPPNPLQVDLRGHLHLHCVDGPSVFDLHGQPVPPEQRLGGERYERSGQYFSAALDAAIDGCQWHRIELRGAIPSGCSIEVRTASAAIELTPDEVDSLPDHAWCTRLVAGSMAPRDSATPADCGWDCLIMSPPGRFLWLQLSLRGDGRATPCVSAALVEYPRISLRRYLPGVFGFDPVGADFTDRLCAIFDTTLRSIEGRLDRQAMLLDPLSAPAGAMPGQTDFLDWLAGWIGVTLSRDWPLARRRHYLKQAARLYCQRGTADGLRRQLLLLLGFDRAYAGHCLAERPQLRCLAAPRNCAPCPPCLPACPPPLILEHVKLRRWLYAGQGRLGSDSVLWGKNIVGRSELSGAGQPPSGNAQIAVTTLNRVPDPLRDPFHVQAHRFSVFVPARIRAMPTERRALEQLLAQETPAHTQADIRYVEPRFRVGVQAMIGLDSVIARTPCGVRLNQAVLRQATVLSGRHAPETSFL